MKRYILALFTAMVLVLALGSVGAYILYLRENSHPIGITPKVNIVIPLNFSSLGFSSKQLYPGEGSGIHGGNLTIFEQVVKTPEGEKKLLIGGMLPFKNGVIRLSTPVGSYTYITKNGSFRFLLPLPSNLEPYNATLFYNGTELGQIPVNPLFGQNVTLEPVENTPNGMVVKAVAQNGSIVKNSTILVSLNGTQIVLYTNTNGTAFLGYRNASITNLSARVISPLPFSKNITYNVLNSTSNGTIVQVFNKGKPLKNSYVPITVGNQTYYVKTNEKGIAEIPFSNFTLSPSVEETIKNTSTTFPERALLVYIILSLIILGITYLASSGLTFQAPLKMKMKRKASPFLLDRHVYLDGEEIVIKLRKEIDLIIDDRLIGRGKVFKLTLTPGIHVLKAEGWSEKIYVFEEPEKALIKLYETMFLELVKKFGVDPTDKTPHEVMMALRGTLPEEPLNKVTMLFELAKYGNRKVTKEQFFEFLSALDELRRGDEVEET